MKTFSAPAPEGSSRWLRSLRSVLLSAEPSPSRKRLVTVGLCLALVLVLGAFLGSRALLHVGKHDAANRPVTLSIVRVADDIDPFATLSIATDAPRGLSILTEHVPVGLDAFGQELKATRSYGRLALQGGESVDALVDRARPWLERHVDLPADVRIGFKEIRGEDAETRRPTVEGVRTVLLMGDALVTNANITRASAAIDEFNPSRYEVTVMLNHQGEERFRLASREAAHRRIAIVLDGRVDNTPTLLGEVRGGFLTVKTGKSELLDEGKQLAGALAGPSR